FCCLSLCIVLFSACGSSTTPASSTPAATPTTAAKGSGNVQVMYAGSLVSIMENQIAPAFKKNTGYTFQGEAKGSVALANEIKGHLHRPDIFISASPATNKQLMGSANGNYVSWYANFARSEMVIGYNPRSHFASDFQAAANGSKPWYQVLEEPGMRIGRTDPILDPKGQATIYLMELAEQYYHQPGLEQKVLGSNENTNQIFPEEELVARIGAGQLDAGFFYINEAKAAHIPYITLPDQINLGNPALASDYAKAQWTNPQTKQVSKGGPVIYTVTIPSTSQNQAGAIAFVNFLLTSQGQSILANNGLLSTPITVSGDATAVPQALQKDIQH
ncbi:MAG TPA: extracellular solute-binding protein, partial [Ktedonobacteraceae bacterium]|nr:extracellular solute-binding protein [Ktedonobacteraceae bacterium]